MPNNKSDYELPSYSYETMIEKMEDTVQYLHDVVASISPPESFILSEVNKLVDIIATRKKEILKEIKKSSTKKRK